MPSKTEKQKNFFGAVMGAKKGQTNVSGDAEKVAKKMPKKEIKKFLKKENEEDEDEQSISKELKKNGKVTFDGPEVKQRKHFAPATKKDKPKKGKGAYNRKNALEQDAFEQDEQLVVKEETNISAMIDNIMQKNYADAYKYLKDTVTLKIQERISKEIDTPLFK